MNLKKVIDFKRKIQSVPKAQKKWCCVWFIDSRDVQDILDEEAGQENRQSTFYELRGKTFCKIGIKFWEEWVWKSDSWALSESEHIEEETTSKWETSDAFKRAWVMWWIWRFLYTLPKIRINEMNYKAYKYKMSEYVEKEYWSRLKTWKKSFNQVKVNNKTSGVSDVSDVMPKEFWKENFEDLKKAKDVFIGADDAIQKALTKYSVSKDRRTKIENLYNPLPV